VKRLADRAKIPIETEAGGEQSQTRHLKDTLLQIHEQIAQRWQNALANEASGQIGRDYLAKRGVSAEAIKLFRIGCAPEVWDDTVNWARSKGFDLALVEKAGLILRKEGSDHYYDRFRGRLMFPICDEQGRVIGFSGRVLSGDEKTAKYVNSPETPIFTKSKVFFGLDKSKRAILDAGYAIICEGQLDLIACFMAGVKNVVAPQGTAFTEQHARILKRYAERVVLCFDSDNAGQNAAVRSLDTILESGPSFIVRKRDDNPKAIGRFTKKLIGDALPTGIAIQVAVVPSPHDPDTFIKQFGVAAFQDLINQAEDFFDYYLNRLLAISDPETDLGRRSIIKAMGTALNKAKDAVLMDKYVQRTAFRLGVTPEAVRIEFKKLDLNENRQGIEESDDESEIEVQSKPPSPHEFWLLKLLFLHEELVDWCAEQMDLNWIQHSLVHQIISKRFEAAAQQSWISLAAFLDDCEAPAMRSLITEAATQDRPIPNPPQQLADVVLRLRNQFIDRQLAALSHRASQPETSDSERTASLREQQDLRVLKRQPVIPPT
jgi:DNA primase (bacterial type)